MRTLDVVIAVVLVVLHLTVHVGFGVGAGAPDLFTLALLILARESHMAVAAAVGLALGLLEDSQGLLAFGANGIAMAIVGALGARTREFFVGESFLFITSYLFLGKWMRDAIHWVALGAENRAEGFWTMVVDAGSGALYMTVAGLFLVVTTGVLRRPGGVR
ncbi:MAG TPA: hypothetical protein VLA43_20870 [Longimicrobiales bacterium]|nr:hypothetical protein [Longimicrobiales bacterium]